MRTCAVICTTLGLAATTPLAPHVTATIRTAGLGPCAGVAALGKEWVADYSTGMVESIDPTTNARVGRPIRIGAQPCGMLISTWRAALRRLIVHVIEGRPEED